MTAACNWIEFPCDDHTLRTTRPRRRFILLVGDSGAQDAGVQVGDVVVSVHNSVAEDPKSLLMDLEGVAAEGETAKMVVMKVSRWS